MIKTIVVIVIALTLSACQIKETFVETGSAISCKLQRDNLKYWIDLENQYQNATVSQQRSLLSKARKDQDKAGLALLLSQPKSSDVQIKQALSLFKNMALEPSEPCLDGRYLNVRYKYAGDLLTLQQTLSGTDQKLKALMKERDNLVKQINALTDIEKDISSQKEGEEN